jgi:hypothetical protein
LICIAAGRKEGLEKDVTVEVGRALDLDLVLER